MSLEKWLVQEGESKVIDLELVRSVKVGLIGGQIDVIGHDEPGARVEVHSVNGRELKISLNGDVLEIDHPQLRWDNFLDVFSRFGRSGDRTDISLMVPRSVALTFGVVRASGLVSGLGTDAKISTVGGDIVVDSVSGDIEVNSVNGEVSVRNHTGSINAHTVSGDVTVSGSISRFDCDGVSGNVFIDAQSAPDRVEVNTVSGDLTLRIDEGLGARYKINTVSGAVQIDGSVIKRSFGQSYSATSGSLDGIWVDVSANTVSGDVTVVRRTVAEHAASERPQDSTEGGAL